MKSSKNPLTELHSLRQLDGLPDPSSVDGGHPEPVTAARAQIFNQKLCVVHRLGETGEPEGAVHLPHLHPVAQDGTASVVQWSEP